MTRLLYITVYVGLLIFIFFGIPDTVIYDNQQDFLSWLPFLLLFVIQPFLVYKIAKTFHIQQTYMIGIAAFSIALFGPAWGIYLGKRQQQELLKNGKLTTGVVYKKCETFKRQKHDEWLLRCNFLAHGKSYSTFSVQDKGNLYKVGDTLHILYSVTTPNNNIIIELEDK